MIKIRTGVFETNSSSTHTCIICTEDNFKKWQNGEYLYVDNFTRILKAALPDYNSHIIDNNFLPVKCIENIKLPKEGYLCEEEIESEPTFKDIFEYTSNIWSPSIPGDLKNDLWAITDGDGINYLERVGLWPFETFTMYYDDSDCGGDIDITKEDITINGQKVPIVAFCATTEN